MWNGTRFSICGRDGVLWRFCRLYMEKDFNSLVASLRVSTNVDHVDKVDGDRDGFVS